MTMMLLMLLLLLWSQRPSVVVMVVMVLLCFWRWWCWRRRRLRGDAVTYGLDALCPGSSGDRSEATGHAKTKGEGLQPRQ